MTKLLECTRGLTCLFLLLTSVVCLADDTSLWKIQKTLAGKKYIDLTHEFAPGIPRWSGFPDETRKTIYWYDKRSDTMGTGFFSELFTHVGQWGTHVDPPTHFVKGLRTRSQLEHLCRCGRIGRNAGPMASKWKTRMRTGWRIIQDGVSPR